MSLTALADKAIAFLLSNENMLGYSVLFVSSIVEYIFPPFPGDTVTLFGAFLIATREWNFIAVLSSVTLGSIIGSCIDYYLGRKLGKVFAENKDREISAGKGKLLTKERYNYITEKFEKYGPAFIIFNRFVPGVRAFFFVVAGITGMSIWSVQFYNLISVVLWNLLIITAGTMIGYNWEQLLNLFQAYSTILGIILIVVFVVLIVKFAGIRNNKKI